MTPKPENSEEPVWTPTGYPETDCPVHPKLMWEWDGYGWVCSGCVVGILD